MISILVGAIVGGLAGVVGSAYLLFFFGLEQISKSAHNGSSFPILSYILLLLCSKVIIVICGALGAVLGCVPGLVGLYYLEED
jgi:uncharacterized membrane protein